MRRGVRRRDDAACAPAPTAATSAAATADAAAIAGRLLGEHERFGRGGADLGERLLLIVGGRDQIVARRLVRLEPRFEIEDAIPEQADGLLRAPVLDRIDVRVLPLEIR